MITCRSFSKAKFIVFHQKTEIRINFVLSILQSCLGFNNFLRE